MTRIHLSVPVEPTQLTLHVLQLVTMRAKAAMRRILRMASHRMFREEAPG